MGKEDAAHSLLDAQIVIVGAGFYGCTIAERIATQLKQKVTIIEARNHIGGNAYSYADSETGIEVHKYGSHLFHTSNEKIWKYVNSFTEFNDYRHSVWITTEGKTHSMPINLSTMSSVFDRSFSPQEAQRFMESLVTDSDVVNNLEDFAISKIGRTLYELLIKNYTWKQWETDPKLLPASTISRLPIRYNFNSRYFSDKYEGLPIHGYGELFENLLKSELIEVRLETDYFSVRNDLNPDALIIYTGAIDRYFDFKLGQLSWRTVDFKFDKLDVPDFQGCAVMNYGDADVPYTRIHEFKHLHPERLDSEKTIIAMEFSRKAEGADEPYYPINTPADRELLLSYRELAKKETNVHFGGRLGTYQYLDMHMAIGAALNDYENVIQSKLKKGG